MKNAIHRHASTRRRLRALCVIAAAIILMSGLSGCNLLFFDAGGLSNRTAEPAAIQTQGRSLTTAEAKTYDEKHLYCTADDFVALREQASASSKELDRVPHGGEMIYLNKKTGHWYYVQYKYKKGYVYDEYVTFDKGAVDAGSASDTLYCTADDYVSLREKSSASSKELARIPRGDKMTDLKNKSGKWYYVMYGSKKGYVYSDYVSTKNPNSSSSSSSKSGGKSGSSSSKSNSSGSKSGSSGSKSGSSGKSSNSGGSSGYYGSFYIPPTPNYKGTRVCKVCNGTRRVTCDACRGEGKFKHTHRTIGLTDEGKTYYTYTLCMRCKGKGYHSCTVCGGDGLY